MAARLTPLSRILITLLTVLLLFFGIRWVINNTSLGDTINNSNSNTSSSNNTSKGKFSGDDDVLKVQLFTWGGYAPGIYFNEGFEASEKSRFYKDYGLKVEFKLIDDFDASRQAWIADEVHLFGNEVSAMATEMSRLAPQDPKVVLQCDWSRGGDAIIVKRGINSINDLKGKKVAVAPQTPSQTLLVFGLESAGMKLEDVKVVEVPSAIDAATAFKAGDVDAAVVWSPDDVIVTRAVAGSKVLLSTKEATNIIADVFMAKGKFAEENPDKLKAFYEGWMRGAAEINAVMSNKDKAAKLLAEGTGLPVEDAMGAIENTRLTTHGDNLNFFGLNVNYTGITGEKLYMKMGNEFQRLGFAPADRPTWREMAWPLGASSANLDGPNNAAEKGFEFDPDKGNDMSKPALATKPVSITFPTGSAVLSENAKTIIDIQFVDVAKAYGDMKIRVEGNTDNTGSRATNMRLSKERAASVVDYLVAQYKMDSNRFVIVGNGPDKPVKGCETNATETCRSKNRRTDFQLIVN